MNVLIVNQSNYAATFHRKIIENISEHHLPFSFSSVKLVSDMYNQIQETVWNRNCFRLSFVNWKFCTYFWLHLEVSWKRFLPLPCYADEMVNFQTTPTP